MAGTSHVCLGEVNRPGFAVTLEPAFSAGDLMRLPNYRAVAALRSGREVAAMSCPLFLLLQR